ncbi:MAG: DUF3450 family protein [Pseudomonadota bacterium]
MTSPVFANHPSMEPTPPVLLRVFRALRDCLNAGRWAARGLGVCWLAIACVSIEAGVGDDVDALIQRWVTIEQQRGTLKANAIEQARLSELQLTLLQAEQRTLRRFVEEMSASDEEVDAQRAQLLAQQAQFEQRDAELAALLAVLVDRLSALEPRLPPPLQDHWATQVPVLRDPAVPLSERLSALLALLTHTAEFEARIALHETMMNVGGADRLVQQVYLGLSRGWYISVDGAWAGSGMAAADGWQWVDESANPAFDRTVLRDAVAQIQARGATVLVQLPVRPSTAARP